MVFEQADVCRPRTLVRLDVGQVLVLDELGEGGDFFSLFFYGKWVLPQRDLISD